MRSAGSKLVHRVNAVVLIEVQHAQAVVSPAYDDGTLTEADMRAIQPGPLRPPARASDDVTSRLEVVVAHLALDEDDEVAEIGCGHGVAATLVLERLTSRTLHGCCDRADACCWRSTHPPKHVPAQRPTSAQPASRRPAFVEVRRVEEPFDGSTVAFVSAVR